MDETQQHRLISLSMLVRPADARMMARIASDPAAMKALFDEEAEPVGYMLTDAMLDYAKGVAEVGDIRHRHDGSAWQKIEAHPPKWAPVRRQDDGTHVRDRHANGKLKKAVAGDKIEHELSHHTVQQIRGQHRLSEIADDRPKLEQVLLHVRAAVQQQHDTGKVLPKDVGEILHQIIAGGGGSFNSAKGFDMTTRTTDGWVLFSDAKTNQKKGLLYQEGEARNKLNDFIAATKKGGQALASFESFHASAGAVLHLGFPCGEAVREAGKKGAEEGKTVHVEVMRPQPNESDKAFIGRYLAEVRTIAAEIRTGKKAKPFPAIHLGDLPKDSTGDYAASLASLTADDVSRIRGRREALFAALKEDSEMAKEIMKAMVTQAKSMSEEEVKSSWAYGHAVRTGIKAAYNAAINFVGHDNLVQGIISEYAKRGYTFTVQDIETALAEEDD